MIFKTVPHAKEYEMSIEGQIRRKDGLPCMVSILNEQPMVTLVIYGKERTVAIEWLRLMTHFEVDLNRRDFWNVNFTPTVNWKYANTVQQTMVFSGPKPEYKPGYRIIPNFTRYAISQFGEIIDTYTGNIIPVCKETNRYITTKCYDPDKNCIRNLLLHRLVALAWVKNPDHLQYYLVNHIDGDRHNPEYTNLEWCCYSKNNQHAYDSRLKLTIPCIVRNIKTGEIKHFNSMRIAADYMQIHPSNLNNKILNNKYSLINNTYEIRKINDTTRWIDNNILLQQINTIKHKGDIIQVYNIKNCNINEYSNITSVSKVINIGIQAIKNALIKGEEYISHGYAFRYKTGSKWNTNFKKYVNSSECILATHNDGRKIECKSIRHTEKLTGVNQKAIARCLKGLPISFDWYFEYL